MENISKFVLSLIFASCLCSCGISQNYKLRYNEIEPTEKQKAIISEIKEPNEIMLFFDGGFLNNKLVIKVNDEIVYDKNIKTDNTLGVAESFTLENSSKNVQVTIDDKSIPIKIKKEYAFVNFDIVDGEISIEYRKIYKKYQ